MQNRPLWLLTQLHRRQLAASEHTVAERIDAAYHHILHHQLLSAHITSVTDAYSYKLQEVRAATGNPRATVPIHWLHERGATGGSDTVAELQRYVQVHVGQFADAAQRHVTTGVQDAAQLGSAHAQQQLHAVVQSAAQAASISPSDLIAPVARSDAQFALTSRLTGSTSISGLFSNFAPDTADRIYRGLLAGLASGENPRNVADLLWSSVGNNLARARTIARTEMLRTYRRSQLDNYRANSDVVQQWQWVCDEGPRTCGACLAMDGTLHPLDEELDGHVMCRCSAQPVTKSWSDILAPFGIDGSELDVSDDEASARLSGADWFAQQDTSTQIQILGKAKQAAYAAGSLKLSDLVAVEHSTQWGTSIREKSLKELGYSRKQVAALLAQNR